MGWQDRHYYRDRGAGSANPLMWLATGSVSLGTWFGINLRAHASLIVFIAISLVLPGTLGGFQNALTAMSILFGIVILHEFGHCLGSHLVGGRPSQIMMHPLGGLASADAPHRPWANFVTVLFGPLVNVAICLVTALMLATMAHTWRAVPWNAFNYDLAVLIWTNRLAYYLWWIFSVSWALLLFNLLPIFPLDGGQMVQSLVWVKFGYYKATIFACMTGMIGAGVVGVAGVFGGHLILVFLAIFGFQFCYYRYREFKANGPWAYEGELDFAAPERGPSRSELRNRKRFQKLQREEANEQKEIDAILAKVSAKGMQSLTFWEKRKLHKATEHQRQRDAELSKSRSRY